ncbi:replication factor A protein 3 [Rhizodiscina lignyota]|uniref:Replication factor A protein 3 n=1 Tax=Rhizodiscina lignyota TaxID=1504668 RepID=A0A9P4IN87_9PEZI|nr:replication factor A protein 3 [Rhizodiscina lignyota]
MDEATPRVTSQYLEQFQNRTIRILGRVTQLRGDQATIDADGQVTVILNRDSHLTLNHAVEIVGKVQSDLSVRVLNATDFGTNIDFTAASAVVDATHRYREIFYGAPDA